MRLRPTGCQWRWLFSQSIGEFILAIVNRICPREQGASGSGLWCRSLASLASSDVWVSGGCLKRNDSAGKYGLPGTPWETIAMIFVSSWKGKQLLMVFISRRRKYGQCGCTMTGCSFAIFHRWGDVWGHVSAILRVAEKFIFWNFYHRWRPMWDSVLEILVGAAQGVRSQTAHDDIGCMATLGRAIIRSSVRWARGL